MEVWWYQDQSGGVLIMVMVFFLVFTIIGTAYLSLAALEGRSSIAQYQRTRAFLLAESALNLSLWRINHGPDYLGTFSNDSLAAVYDSTTYILTGTGFAGNATRQLQVQLFKDHPFNHIVSYQTLLDTSNFSLSSMTGHGISRFNPLPGIASALNYYQDSASYRYYSDQTFSGTMSSGIHFVDGNATMKNGTVLNGTLIVTEGVKFLGAVTINAQKDKSDTTRYYPALIAGDTAQTEIDITGNPQLIINGAVYSNGYIIFKGKLISGPIVAPKVILKSGVEINDQNSARYYRYPAGFDSPENFDWKKLIVKGSWRRIG